MDWLKQWNEALDYLEEHLLEEISLETLGRIACCGGYHFQRMFSYLAGVPLSEYIRRRRMTLAAAELRGGARVIDTALRYGYESPTAFNRAFQSVHGLPPSAVRRDGAVLRSYPRIRFHLVVKGDVEMEYYIVTRPAFRIVGLRTPLPKDAEEGFALVPQCWAEAGPRLPELLGLSSGEPAGVLGVSTCHRERDNYYYIAVASQQEPPAGMYAEEIPGCTWAVFQGRGRLPEAMQDMQRRIVAEWLPDAGYEWAQAADVEVYLEPPGPGETAFQVWLPVVRR